jgi:HEPN domain-containing protein
MSARPDEALDPTAWLRRAESSLIRPRSGHGVPGVLLEDLCFDAQQAVEKGLNALLVAHEVDFPKTHAIAELITRLNLAGVSLPQNADSAAELTLYAVRTRYPGGPSVTEEDYQAAMQIAEDIIEWVRRQLPGAGDEV